MGGGGVLQKQRQIHQHDTTWPLLTYVCIGEKITEERDTHLKERI